MNDGSAPAEPDKVVQFVQRHWKTCVAVIWAVMVASLIYSKWKAIGWYTLSDTDDNIRMAQVRGLLNGQGWYDLRQYKLDPPGGASIHWTRLVDLPIAGIILAVRPFTDWLTAEKIAAAFAPLIPMGVGLYATALTTRRLVAPPAYVIACAVMLCGASTMGMWTPMRVDHHGWQIALVLVTVAGLADPRPARGGAITGAAMAMSLTIGLEMLPQFAAAGAAMALMWVVDPRQAPRLLTFSASLAGLATLGFLGFASYDNSTLTCDALSPIWLSVVLVGAALGTLIALAPARSPWLRLAMAAGAGALILAFYVIAWPKCVGPLERLSPELQKLWFSHIREARPTYYLDYKLALALLAMPVAGFIGGLLALRKVRHEPERLRAWCGALAVSASAFGLLFWQIRAGPVAQALAAPGCAMIAWLLLPRALAIQSAGSSPRRLLAMLARVAAIGAVFVLASGLVVQFSLELIPNTQASKTRAQKMKQIAAKSAHCPTLPALAAIERIPATTVLTFIDFGPRLINTTHHKAIAGPYHRNQAALLDVIHAWRGSPDTAHDVIRRHGIGMVLICPGMSESTIYMAEAKNGFYMQLLRGRTPPWLERITLPKGSPFRAWKVIG
jgi:hypothetical protein